jgi:glutamine synthetase adenylyltransferase
MPDKDTLRLLTHLNASGLLEDRMMRALYEAYLYLRTLDHCIRLVYDRPLPALPSDPARLREIAATLHPEDPGESAPRRLMETLAARRKAVREVYESVVLAATPQGGG